MKIIAVKSVSKAYHNNELQTSETYTSVLAYMRGRIRSETRFKEGSKCSKFILEIFGK